MKLTATCLLFVFISLVSFSQSHLSADEQAIRKILSDQVEAWNKGDLDLFMKGYWQNDSLKFVSTRGVTYGYGNALRRYKDTYNSPDKMGQLFFTLLHVDRLSGEYYFITGKWFLKRTAGDIGGYYTLLFRKIDGSWKIVVDHTS